MDFDKLKGDISAMIPTEFLAKIAKEVVQCLKMIKVSLGLFTATVIAGVISHQNGRILP